MKITKKVIKEAPAFILGIDYKSSYKPLTIDLESLIADNLLDAMKEANNYFDYETVWCLRIYSKTDIIEDDRIYYKQIIGANRENRWEVLEENFILCSYSLESKEPSWNW